MDQTLDLTRVRLETSRLALRFPRETDAEDIFSYASVPGVGEMAGWPPHASLEESRKILDAFIREKNVLVLEEKASSRVIGTLGLHPAEWANETAVYAPLNIKEIGYVLAKPHWGKGLMPEAVRRVIAWCFEEAALDALTVCHFRENDQSRRVIEKCGFTFVKKDVWHSSSLDQDFEDMAYILLRTDWEKKQ